MQTKTKTVCLIRWIKRPFFQCCWHEILQDLIYVHFLFQIQNANDVLIAPLEKFRKEQIGAAKVSVTFYYSLDILLIIKDDIISDINIFEIRMTF